MTKAFSGLSFDHLNELHAFLTARGWELDEFTYRDDDGQPVDPDTAWYYADSFGGITMHRIDDLSPCRLTCRFGLEDDGLSIVLGAAGNYKGCVEHAETEHSIAAKGNQLDLDRVTVLLDDLEPHARKVNPKDLVECRFFGRCGENYLTR